MSGLETGTVILETAVLTILQAALAASNVVPSRMKLVVEGLMAVLLTFLAEEVMEVLEAEVVAADALHGSPVIGFAPGLILAIYYLLFQI